MVAQERTPHHGDEWSAEEMEAKLQHFERYVQEHFPELAELDRTPGARFLWREGDLIPVPPDQPSEAEVEVASS